MIEKKKNQLSSYKKIANLIAKPFILDVLLIGTTISILSALDKSDSEGILEAAKEILTRTNSAIAVTTASSISIYLITLAIYWLYLKKNISVTTSSLLSSQANTLSDTGPEQEIKLKPTHIPIEFDSPSLAFYETKGRIPDRQRAFLECNNQDVVENFHCDLITMDDKRILAVSDITLGRTNVRLGKFLDTNENVVVKIRCQAQASKEIKALKTLKKLVGTKLQKLNGQEERFYSAQKLAYDGREKNLEQWIKENYPQGNLPAALGLRIWSNILKAVIHIHSIKIAHNDLKFDNIIFNAQDLSIELVDFGASNTETNNFDWDYQRLCEISTCLFSQHPYLQEFMINEQDNIQHMNLEKIVSTIEENIDFYDKAERITMTSPSKIVEIDSLVKELFLILKHYATGKVSQAFSAQKNLSEKLPEYSKQWEQRSSEINAIGDKIRIKFDEGLMKQYNALISIMMEEIQKVISEQISNLKKIYSHSTDFTEQSKDHKTFSQSGVLETV